MTIAITSITDERGIKQELRSSAALMSRVLRGGRSLEREYPLVFCEGFPGKVIKIEDQQAVRSALAVLVRSLIVPGTQLRVALVGSVVTDPALQSQGLASMALDAAENYARAEGCVATLLWADDPRFYCGRGYRAVGTEVDISLPIGQLCTLPCSAGIRAANLNDALSIHALYLGQPLRVSRRVEETAVLLRIPQSRTLVLEEQGVVVAYASMGRGEDLRNIVHEWAGAPLAVLALMRAQAERFYEAQSPLRAGEQVLAYAIAPDHPLEVTRRLSELDFPMQRGVLCMGKLVDRAAATEHILQRCEDKVEAARPVLAELSDRELLECLLPARSESQNLIEIAERIGVPAEKLPTFAFAWGFDSI